MKSVQVLFIIFLFNITMIKFSNFIRISTIMIDDPNSLYGYQVTVPAVRLAVEFVNRKYPEINMTASYRNASLHCEASKAGPIAAEEYYKNDVSAFIGPACSIGLDQVNKNFFFFLKKEFYNSTILRLAGWLRTGTFLF